MKTTNETHAQKQDIEQDIKNGLTADERAERLDRFNSDVLDDLFIQEQSINPHDCEHTPNHLIPLRIEKDKSTNRKVIISKCTHCGGEIAEDYQLPYREESMMN